jgi:lipopolysaccharide export system permease protein
VRIIDRYLLREMLVPFALGLAVFTTILLIARILKLVELVVNRGVPVGQMLKLFSYILPAFLEVTVPMALLLAILVAFGRLSSDREITALHASGVDLARLAAPVAGLAVATALLTLALSLYARPWANGRLRTTLYETVKARASAGLKPRVFNAEFEGLVIYVDRVEPPGNSLHGVLISDTRDPRLHNTVFARFGILVTSEDARTLTLRLLDGGIYSAPETGGGFQDTRFSTYDISLDLDATLARVRAREKDVSEMHFAELRATIEQRRAAGQPSFVERAELHRKFAIAFAPLVFGALGVPLGIRPSRAVHSWSFAVSLALIFLYYLLLTLGQNLAENGALPPPLALWLANGALSILAVGLLRRAGGPSVPHRGWGRLLAHRLPSARA